MTLLASRSRCVLLIVAWLPLLPSSCSPTGPQPGFKKSKRHDVVQRGKDHTQSRFEALGTLSFVPSKSTQGQPAHVEAGAHVDGEPTTKFMTWPTSADSYRNVDGAKSYRLEFLEDKIGSPKPHRIEHTLFRVQDPESMRILADASVCPVHQVTMERELENAVYGGDYPDSYFLKSGPWATKFPNDGKAYLMCGSGISHLTWTCPSCRHLSDEWAKRHNLPK